MRRTLYGLGQSMWTERARWALDHHGMVYSFHEHVPLVGEMLLRRKAKTKKASVPLLADGDTVVMGSFEIAKHAEGLGRGAPLFPRDADTQIAHWVDVSERMARIARALFFRSFAASREAQAENLPPFVPQALRKSLAPTALLAVRYLAKKYEVPEDIDREVEHTLRPLLEEVREHVTDRRYILSAFTFADIAVAATMQLLRPRDGADLGPATRAAWTNEALARDFEDLLGWRDAIYGKHR